MSDTTYLSIAEFAERVKAHPNTVRRYIREGRIDAMIRGGTRYMIAESQIDRLYEPVRQPEQQAAAIEA